MYGKQYGELTFRAWTETGSNSPAYVTGNKKTEASQLNVCLLLYFCVLIT